MKMNSDRARSTWIGLCALLVFCVSAGISVPMVKKYHQFLPESLLFVRSGAILVFVGLWKLCARVSLRPDRALIGATVMIAIASLTFFEALNVWSPNPVIMVVTLTPLVNFTVAIVARRKIPWVIWGCLIVIFGGVMCALRPDKYPVHPWGLVLTILATVSTGAGLEYWSRTKTTAPAKMFWYSSFTMLGSLGMLVHRFYGKFEKFSFIPNETPISTTLFVFLIVGCLGGVAYLISMSIVAGRLPPVMTSILLQGETPAVIIGSAVFIGEVITLSQWGGVALMLIGISVLLWWKESTDRHAEKSVTHTPPG